MVTVTPSPGINPTLEFDLRFEGPALQASEMDVRDFAPALISTADLFQATNRLLHPADPDVSVNIRATTQGSFEVLLKLIYEDAVGVLLSPPVLAGESLVALLGIVGGTIRYRKKRGTTEVVSQEPAEEPGLVKITFADGTVMEFPADVLSADADARVRKSLRDVARPLNRPGITSVSMMRGDDIIGQIDEAELPSFDFDDTEVDREILVDSTTTLLVQITAAVFQSGNKWRFSDGEHTFWASMDDPDFIQRIDQGEPFAKGDMLRCEIRTLQWRDLQGALHAEKSLTRVLEHLGPAAPMPPLFIAPPQEDTEPPALGTGS